MKMKISLVVIAFLLISGSVVYGQTDMGMTITNIASVTAQNVSVRTSGRVDTNVLRIVGASYTVIPADAPGNSSDTVNLIFTIRNDGNASDTYTLSTNSTTNGGVIGANWAISWLPSNPTPAVPAGDTTIFTLQVVVNGAAVDGSFIGYKVEALSDNTNTAIKEGVYQGDNGSWYCGDMGICVLA